MDKKIETNYNFDGNAITGLADPVNPTDAVNLRSLSASTPKFIYIQSEPASLWHIVHSLGKLYPNIVIVDSANDLIQGYGLNPIDINTLQLSFSAAFSGEAVLT